MKTIRKSGETVSAEMGKVRGLSGGLEDCLILFQGDREKPVALAFAGVAGDKIQSIDLCIVPRPETAVRSGQYPREERRSWWKRVLGWLGRGRSLRAQ